ncbi:MAG: sulfur carrier protein ThiS [Gammaproteobacteria bacterium]
MEILVNGKPRSVPAEFNVAQLLADLNLTGRLATEINHEIVPRSRYTARRLQSGDRVEIVRAIGGG